MEALNLPAQKNFHASVPAALLERAEAIAQQEQISIDELAAEALRGHIARHALDRFRSAGETRRHGLSDEQVESIVDRALHEHRQEHGR